MKWWLVIINILLSVKCNIMDTNQKQIYLTKIIRYNVFGYIGT